MYNKECVAIAAKEKNSVLKRFEIAFLTGAMMVGSVIAVSGMNSVRVSAEESQITLNVAQKEAETEAETEAAESEETFPQIANVQTGDSLITAVDVSAVVEQCMPSIVSITSTAFGQIESFYGIEEYEAYGSASGIIIAQTDDELLIATNNHVVADTEENFVWFTIDTDEPEQYKVPAKIKGTDRASELAILAVKLSDIPKEAYSQIRIAELGSSSDLKVGQTAIAIGNELGYGQAVTCGIISALDREVGIDDYNAKHIMIDTTINFGSSGGAILNSKGQVIGICVAKETGQNSEGMGYAIPIDTAIPILEKLAARQTRDKLESTERGYMGVTVINVTDDAKELYAMPQGAFVYEVLEGSAGEKAGIKKGDVITKFDGESVSGSDDLVDKMSYYNVDETVTVEVMTANNGEYEAREVEVTLQAGGASANQQDEPEEEEELF